MLKWLTPFGTEVSGEMVGTNEFPSIRVLDDGVLPLQVDAFSCAIGLVAGIAIVLRQVIGRSTPEELSDYNRMFLRSVMNVITVPYKRGKVNVDEHACFFPRGLFKPLPSQESWGRSSYLHVLKAEWFQLFDRMAELRYNTLSRGEKINPEYASIESELQTYKWPKHPYEPPEALDEAVTSDSEDLDEKKMPARTDSEDKDEKKMPARTDSEDKKKAKKMLAED